MYTYRNRNGHVDNGAPVRGARKYCPACKSTNFKETLSREKCNACGYEVDYWGGGANEVAQNYRESREDEPYEED